MKTEKHSELPNVLFGHVLSLIILIFGVLFLSATQAQTNTCLLTGRWFEVNKKRVGYHVPLQIDLQADSTAKYINLYPEKSLNLTWSCTADSVLTLSNGNSYKILYCAPKQLRLRTKSGKKGKIITLKQFAYTTNRHR